MKVLLDTNVVSEAVAARPSERVLTWLGVLDPEEAFLSAITVGELHRGAERMPPGQRRSRLRAWLHEDLLIRFEGRILAVTTEVMLAWGALSAQLEREGRTLPRWDSLLAAQALHFNCTLATRNVRDFERTGVSLFNPWD